MSEEESITKVETSNSSITVNRPIYSVEEIENVTKVGFYTLTNLVIEADGRTLDIDESIPANSSLGMDPGDVIRITYKWRSPLDYTFGTQPVRSISSILASPTSPMNIQPSDVIENLQGFRRPIAIILISPVSTSIFRIFPKRLLGF